MGAGVRAPRRAADGRRRLRAVHRHRQLDHLHRRMAVVRQGPRLRTLSRVRALVVAAPGFAADCLETSEELAIRGRDQFRDAGGVNFAALDFLNDSAAGMDMLEALIRRELAGWLDE